MPKKVKLGSIEMPPMRNRFCFMALAEAYTYYLHFFPNGSHIWMKKWWDFNDLDVLIDAYRLIGIGTDYPVKKAQRSLVCICILSNSNNSFAAIHKLERAMNIIAVYHNIGLRLMNETLYSLPAPKGFSEIEIEFDKGVSLFKSSKSAVKRHNPFTYHIEKKGEIFTQYELMPDIKGPFDGNIVVIKMRSFHLIYEIE